MRQACSVAELREPWIHVSVLIVAIWRSILVQPPIEIPISPGLKRPQLHYLSSASFAFLDIHMDSSCEQEAPNF